MNKTELRKKYLVIRKNIINKPSKSNIIFNKIINSETYLSSNVIALYFNYNSEVSTKRLIEYSLNNNKIVLLPKINDNETMNFYKIESINKLKANIYNILEPDNTNKYDINSINLMIIPGICFDNSFNRIGYGKAYYDKYLSSDNNIIKMGICFDEQLLKDECINNDKYDIKMDIIVTNKKILINNNYKGFN